MLLRCQKRRVRRQRLPFYHQPAGELFFCWLRSALHETAAAHRTVELVQFREEFMECGITSDCCDRRAVMAGGCLGGTSVLYSWRSPQNQAVGGTTTLCFIDWLQVAIGCWQLESSGVKRFKRSPEVHCEEGQIWKCHPRKFFQCNDYFWLQTLSHCHSCLQQLHVTMQASGQAHSPWPSSII